MRLMTKFSFSFSYNMTSLIMQITNKIMKKKVSLWLLCGVQHSVIMADFLVPETQSPIVVIIYSPYFSKDLTAISSSFLCKLPASL